MKSSKSLYTKAKTLRKVFTEKLGWQKCAAIPENEPYVYQMFGPGGSISMTGNEACYRLMEQVDYADGGVQWEPVEIIEE